MCIYLSLGIIVCELFCLFVTYMSRKIFGYFACGVMVCITLSPHTHCAYHEWGLIPGMCNLELEGIV